MSNIKLDLKMFRHAKSDGKTTTLQHVKDGHTITLVHGALSKPAQAQLAALSKQSSKPSDRDEAKQDRETQMMKDGGWTNQEQHSKVGMPTSADTSSTRSNAEYIKNTESNAPTAVEKQSDVSNEKAAIARDKQPGFWASGGEIADAPQGRGDKPLFDTSGYPKGGNKPVYTGYAEGGPTGKEGSKGLTDVSDPSQPDWLDRLAGAIKDKLMPVPQQQQEPAQQAQGSSPQEGSVIQMPKLDVQNAQEASGQSQAVTPMDTTSPAVATNSIKPQPAQQQPPPQPQAAPMHQAAPAPQANSGNVLTQPVGPNPSDPDQTFNTYKQKHMAEIEEQNAKWAQDLANGHIEPKTYHGLFEDKSTPGKIMTIFGLMMGGMGSGLTGQPNAALKMMDNQIEKDLDAQTKSKANAQNFLRLKQQQEAQNAQIPLTQAQALLAQQDARLKAKALANSAMLHTMTLEANKYPVGSDQWNKAQAALRNVAAGVQSENYNLQDRAASMQALMEFSGPNGPVNSPDQEDAFKSQNYMLRRMGNATMADANEARHVTGIPGSANRPIDAADRPELEAMTQLDAKGRDLQSFIEKHKGLDLDRWNPDDRAAAQQKVEEMKNFYNTSIHGGALTQGRLGWYDEQFAKNPLDILPQLLGSNARFKEMIDSNDNRRKIKLKQYGLTAPSMSTQSPAQTGGFKEGQTGKTPQGRPTVFKNGKWQFQ